MHSEGSSYGYALATTGVQGLGIPRLSECGKTRAKPGAQASSWRPTAKASQKKKAQPIYPLFMFKPPLFL